MDNNRTCETCGPHGLRVGKVNGVTQVEVPQDFVSAKLGSMDRQVAQAVSFFEGALRMQRTNGRSLGQFTLADTSASDVLPGGNVQGIQFGIVAVKSTAYAGRCPGDPSKVVIVIKSTWVDENGDPQSLETRSEECFDPDTASTMLRRLNGGK
ncbi:MAG: hypothetical protein M5U25_02300 [Planctomycetota bacterium]|nr:hypothetical protein [Planctomycetota bacterium]